MSLSTFYEEIDFDVSRRMITSFRAKQGDKDSRGFFVRILNDGEQVSTSGITMTAYFTSALNEPFEAAGAITGDRFRVTIPSGVFKGHGIAKGELVLYQSGGVLADETFEIKVEKSVRLADTGGVRESQFELLENRVKATEKRLGVNETAIADLKKNKADLSLVNAHKKELDDKIKLKADQVALDNLAEKQGSGNLDTGERFTLTLEVKNGQPRLKMEEI